MILGAVLLAATVAWQPWSPLSLQAARDQNKPIFLSIGYSTCHWCHVMDQETFSDREIGAVVNAHFIPIKVDREERPDVDSAYMAAAQKLMSDPGWPLNIVLTPDGRPFFAATYVPKDRLRPILEQLASMWNEHPDRIEAMAAMVMQSLEQDRTPADSAIGAELLKKSYQQLSDRFDALNGGFLPAPKFPATHQLMFLLRYWKRSGDAHALEMVETTLRAMRRGAIWDAKRSGFHRYAVDAAWQQPHFEKMLCDQALLAMAYLETYQATRKNEYARTARDIFTYVLRDLRTPNGAFYAGHDSDNRSARDEIVMSDWNGLMIAALSLGAVVLNDEGYVAAAKRAASVVLSPGRLTHEGGRPAYLDDYAFVVWGLLNLYEATFEVRYLEKALDLEHEALHRFRDGDGRFYLTANDAEKLLVRPRETGDGSLPSGNSVQLMNLVRLARITGDADLEKAANDLVRSTADAVALIPSASAHLMSAVDFLIGPSFEVVLAGGDVRQMRRAAFSSFVPNKVVLRADPEIARIAPFTKEQKAIGGKPTAYVCTRHLCKLPSTDPRRVTEMLER